MDEEKINANKSKGVNRRYFMEFGAWTSAGVVGLAMAASGTRFVVGDSLDAPSSKWVQVGKIDDFGVGQIHKIKYSVRRQDAWRTVEQKGVLYVFRDVETEYTVLDSTCTHLGCNVHWQEENQHFRCPCHEAYFDRAGDVLSGPPPAPLARLETKVEDGILLAKV